jgi:hypothetical protein
MHDGVRVPDDDPEPRWLRDYASIEADLQGLREVAAALEGEHRASYEPHRRAVEQHMVVPSGLPAQQFTELVALLERHDESRQLTNALLAAHGNATSAFVRAARHIAEAYGDADGLAAARAHDVAQMLLGAAEAWPAKSAVDPR